jgi:hypothetical protein
MPNTLTPQTMGTLRILELNILIHSLVQDLNWFEIYINGLLSTADISVIILQYSLVLMRRNTVVCMTLNVVIGRKI